MAESVTIARACAQAADDKKAADIALLDMREAASFTDFFVICGADSIPQIRAIADAIRVRLREDFHRRPQAEDGFPASQWVVLDYGDVVIHIFHNEKRTYYGLESLWSDAPRLDWSGLPRARSSS